MTASTELESRNEADAADQGRLGTAAARVRDGIGTVRSRATGAARAVRGTASDAYENAKTSAGRVGRSTAEAIETNPSAVVLSGLALGALVAVILPRGSRESELLARYGRRVTDAARDAASAARQAGVDKLDELGLNVEGAKQKLGDFTSGAREALRSSAAAASDNVRSRRGRPQDQ